MALIIKRPMPHKCDWCFYRGHCEVRMKHIHDTFGKYDSFTDPYREQRLPNCPLVEIPDEHGRLIDADANREDFMNIVYSELHSDGDNYRANRIIDKYDNAPTVLEASECQKK